MAKMDFMIPFILHFETGVTRKPGETLQQLFFRAKQHGFAIVKYDSGGATQCGVTIATYRTWCKKQGLPTPSVYKLKALPYDHWYAILKEMFWDRWKADEIRSQSVAEILVDWVWASGRYGVVIPQHMLGVKADGIVGPRTLAAVNSQDPRDFFDRIRSQRIAFVQSIVAHHHTQERFLKGWERRIYAIPFKD